MLQPMLDSLSAWLSTHGLRVAVYAATAWILYRLLEAAMVRLERLIAQRGEGLFHEQRKRAVTLANVFRSVGVIMILLTGGLLVLEEFGVDITPLLAGASIAGVAIGFGSQTLVRDIIGGMFVLLEDQYHFGDVIKVAGVSGTVERITLRTTHLRDADGTMHLVPNGEIRIVSNATSGWSRALVDVRVNNSQNFGSAMQALRAAVDEANADDALKPFLLEPLTIGGVVSLDTDTVSLRITAKTKAGQQETINRALRQRIRERLETDGIEGPPKVPPA